ncbi:hypothetical protein GCM10017567_85890 [Amycolatopsis bullii]|uniref:Secreted protein n=1 Tax=Amycolatopsis bullii TaxID=941987 RepID=A0ABQ3KS40_9PSEU|nr:hypothetical protein GCM10017567_85890 [Amycolatopsis bullii]
MVEMVRGEPVVRVLVVVVLVVELVACGPPAVEVKGRAVPVPVRTGAPPGELLGDTPVAPVVVKL